MNCEGMKITMLLIGSFVPLFRGCRANQSSSSSTQLFCGGGGQEHKEKFYY